ncbi:HalOD1 output domain-containing protein [Halomontanus rarus]|uniref:HalOD1 output domain-containing protein n=1 Tax=Halomontanus rarus TaxID=3034020 RepID=UPI0023E89C77|nr:HalOD1 output domain-containing protein [Halovivax sp. TS33]
MNEDLYANDGVVRRRYRPGEENASLSNVVLRAIDDHSDEALTRGDRTLYDQIDPDALDTLFREDGDAPVTLQFAFDGMNVSLWCEETVEIRVSGTDSS